MSTGPVESKVKAGAFGAAVAGVVVWVLETYTFSGAVPLPVQAVIDIGVPAIFGFLFAYAAKHTFRNDADAVNSAEGPPAP